MDSSDNDILYNIAVPFDQNPHPLSHWIIMIKNYPIGLPGMCSAHW